MKLLKNTQVNRTQWESFLSSNPFATPFQSPEFYDFFNAVHGLSAFVYAIEQSDEIKALCVVTLQKEKGIKGYFSRRAIIYGGPLIASHNKEALSELLKAISSDLKSKAIYIETRNLNNYTVFSECFASAGWMFEPHLNYLLNCDSEEIVLANLNTNRKRQIKKALKSGAQLTEAKTLQEVADYYNILSNLYVNKIKKPIFNFDFFQLLFEKNQAKFLLVKLQDKIIGGIVCPFLKDQTIYELYICGLDSEYKDLSPSVMATYAAIEYGFKNGYKKFDFMGAGKPDEDYGVRDFKAKFGGELVEHGRFIKINNLFLFNLGKFALDSIKKLKK